MSAALRATYYSLFTFWIFDYLMFLFAVGIVGVSVILNHLHAYRTYILKSASPLFSKLTKQCAMYDIHFHVYIYLLWCMVHVCVNAINAVLIHRYTTINDTLFIRSNEIFKNNKVMQMILRLPRRQRFMVTFA